MDRLKQGTILRSHAGGCLVYQPDLDTNLQCSLRGRLKKERVSILTGDRVELDEVNEESFTAVIASRLDRENALSRPPLANVDQVVIVQAIHQPEWNSLWCDRYLVHFQLEAPSVSVVLCLNKSDLAQADETEVVKNIYEALGYTVVIVSAYTKAGIVELEGLMRGKLTVLAGPSGVGKSSLLNVLEPSLNLKVGVMENEFGVGRHTTTASEIYRLKSRFSEVDEATWVADSPGFSLAELRHPEPLDVGLMFPEIAELSQECRFSNCLHLVELSCSILANLDKSMKVASERYQSYVVLVNEALAEQKLRQDSSTKVESSVKSIGGTEGRAKKIPRLSGRNRAPSRSTKKQELITSSVMSEEEPDD
jgi:ribosome biogenesis GTPase / thiamine phosphate phosphatase